MNTKTTPSNGDSMMASSHVTSRTPVGMMLEETKIKVTTPVEKAKSGNRGADVIEGEIEAQNRGK